MKTAATVFVSTLVFIGLGLSFVAGCVTGFAIADMENDRRKSYIHPHTSYAAYDKRYRATDE